MFPLTTRTLTDCRYETAGLWKRGTMTLAATIVAALLTHTVYAQPKNVTSSERPNIVIIMTDNHGAWTLGCYGNNEIRTPNIDRLAAQGTLFTHCFSSNSVCSPTRATFLTGLIPSQHGVHCWLHPGRLQMGAQANNTIEEFRSLPEILSDAGYVCGLAGKWHLGANLHPQDGFSYWVTKPQGGTRALYDDDVIEDGEVRIAEGYATDFWTDHGRRFITMNRDRPFFLLLAYNGPYGLHVPMLSEARNRHAAYYADKELQSFPRLTMHPWLLNCKENFNNPVSIRRYAAEVSGIDDGVGKIMQTLQTLGLDENTLVVFTADQGLCGGHHGLWGMSDHSRPLHTYDETIHVPLIFRYPGHIPSNRRLAMMTSNYDLFPTLLTYLGLAGGIPTEPESPGRDFSPVLCGESMEWDDVIFYEFENSRMIRTRDWKYTWRFPHGPNELYHLAEDAGEEHNLIDQPEYADRQQQLRGRLDAFFNRYADPKYDLAHGGDSKTVPFPTRVPVED